MNNLNYILKPCPFCGMKPPEDLSDTLYPTCTGWRELKEEGLEGLRHYFHIDEALSGDGRVWSMHCTTNMGGCGVQIRADSEEDVIDAWNTRSDINIVVPNRRVVCAANRAGTHVVLGARHFDAIMHMSIEATYGYYRPDPSNWEQGFIDQRGEFLTREEAWIVAEEAGQIIRRVGGDFNDETKIGRLFSENLY